MGDFLTWLLHDDRKDLYEALVALALGLVCFGLLGLLLWPAGRLALLPVLAQGYAVFWGVAWLTAGLAGFLMRRLRVNMYDHGTAYVVAGLVSGALLQMGWSAFAALAVQASLGGAPLGGRVLSHAAGGLTCVAASFVLGAVYQGTLYRLVHLPLALLSYGVFSLWPAGAAALYGWFFRLVGSATIPS
ncbi:MAG TPA: hypothetical protein DD490_23855 [Acidobacteria bacterium]|nr:hypothetical protein [Acidobacteriota bacterium]